MSRALCIQVGILSVIFIVLCVIFLTTVRDIVDNIKDEQEGFDEEECYNDRGFTAAAS